MSIRRAAVPVILALTILPRSAPGADAAPADAKARVDTLFAAYDRSDSPGCVLGIFQDGGIAYARGYGMANLELGVANTPQTVFDIGSLGKQFTAFSVLLLARDGKLSLDDDVRKYLPELPDFGKKVTIRHLLHHTGGLRDYIGLLGLEGHGEEDLTTSQEALDVLARQKAPIFAPGERYEYSNTGYFLLSWVVKRTSGQSLREFAQERIFGPLGMSHTQYNEDHTRVIPNRATGYTPRKDGGFSIEMSDWEQNGDGGVLTSVEDLFLWDRNFADPRVGDRALIEEMEKTGVLNDGKAIDYAKGLRIASYRGLRTVGHTGSWAGYLALLYRFPEAKFTVACLCNRTGVNRVRSMRQIADIYLADRLQLPAEASAEEAARGRPGGGSLPLRRRLPRPEDGRLLDGLGLRTAGSRPTPRAGRLRSSRSRPTASCRRRREASRSASRRAPREAGRPSSRAGRERAASVSSRSSRGSRRRPSSRNSRGSTRVTRCRRCFGSSSRTANSS